MNTQLSFHPIIQCIDKDYNIQLNEETERTENSVCIEGRYFSIQVNGENVNLQYIQNKIIELHQYPSVTLRQFYAKILDMDEEKLQIDPKFETFASIRSLALQEISRINEKESKQVDSFFSSFHPKTFKEKVIEKFEDLQISECALSDRLITIEEKLSNLEREKNSLISYVAMPVIESIYLAKKRRIEKEIKEHDIQMLKKLFQIHQQISVTSETDQLKADMRLAHLLELAIITDQLPSVNELIRGGAKPTMYHLYLSVIANSAKLVRHFVEEGLDPNAPGKNEWSLLEIACLRGQKNSIVIKELITLGADLQHRSKNGNTPIHEALSSDLSSETIKELLHHIDDLNLKGSNDASLLDKAILRFVLREDGDLSILQYLLEHGADPNCKDAEGMTPLHKAIKYINNEKSANQVISLLIQYGAVPTVTNSRGQTPLHFAAEQAAWSSDTNLKDSDLVVQTLIKNGAKVNAQDNLGLTPLHEAVRYGSNDKNTKSLISLIKAGANLDIQNHEGNTPLHLAVEMEHVRRVQLLLTQGANRHIRNHEGKLPGGMGIFGYYISEKRMNKILELLAEI